MKKFCEETIALLNQTHGKKWAEEYVRLRIEFHRKHGHGLILSTWHGIDFFHNVLNGITKGEIFTEPNGEYRNNFIKLISIGTSEA